MPFGFRIDVRSKYDEHGINVALSILPQMKLTLDFEMIPTDYHIPCNYKDQSEMIHAGLKVSSGNYNDRQPLGSLLLKYTIYRIHHSIDNPDAPISGTSICLYHLSIIHCQSSGTSRNLFDRQVYIRAM